MTASENKNKTAITEILRAKERSKYYMIWPKKKMMSVCLADERGRVWLSGTATARVVNKTHGRCGRTLVEKYTRE